MNGMMHMMVVGRDLLAGDRLQVGNLMDLCCANNDAAFGPQDSSAKNNLHYHIKMRSCSMEQITSARDNDCTGLAVYQICSSKSFCNLA